MIIFYFNKYQKIRLCFRQYFSSTSERSTDKIVKVGSKKNLELFQPKISIVGIGGGGGNAINHMIRNQLCTNVESVDFLVCNTDHQDLLKSLSKNRVQLGPKLTRGFGAGNRPDIGRRATEESISEVIDNLKHSDLIFLAAGMGGGTGSGGTPVIAKQLKSLNKDILIVAFVTRPFRFEGKIKDRYAYESLEELTGGDDISLKEIGRAMSYLQEKVHPDAIMKVGHYYDNSLNGKIRISVLFVQ
ncbi:mitochondrial cell division protein [Heterostelium album PN500]|uniref:Mitochondrial cell division protein n=1 Tax=Heterostelium pallidum (strain ATCC 26659 / Pp 5 / PN500) TaxID=670386 RepID=D3B0Q3_HETP5|nr:mitochondrial cell division protein [Heterostelium album PN500]EFA84877.1 mitochondrial cell division protein [Heterostelium album PN500]|eukprot:XP_020436988.1 mitochondrial cell division protein [Heterostelium album PN500]